MTRSRKTTPTTTSAVVSQDASAANETPQRLTRGSARLLPTVAPMAKAPVRRPQSKPAKPVRKLAPLATRKARGSNAITLNDDSERSEESEPTTSDREFIDNDSVPEPFDRKGKNKRDPLITQDDDGVVTAEFEPWSEEEVEEVAIKPKSKRKTSAAPPSSDSSTDSSSDEESDVTDEVEELPQAEARSKYAKTSAALPSSDSESEPEHSASQSEAEQPKAKSKKKTSAAPPRSGSESDESERSELESDAEEPQPNSKKRKASAVPPSSESEVEKPNPNSKKKKKTSAPPPSSDSDSEAEKPKPNFKNRETSAKSATASTKKAAPPSSKSDDESSTDEDEEEGPATVKTVAKTKTVTPPQKKQRMTTAASASSSPSTASQAFATNLGDPREIAGSKSLVAFFVHTDVYERRVRIFSLQHNRIFAVQNPMGKAGVKGGLYACNFDDAGALVALERLMIPPRLPELKTKFNTEFLTLRPNQPLETGIPMLAYIQEVGDKSEIITKMQRKTYMRELQVGVLDRQGNVTIVAVTLWASATDFPCVVGGVDKVLLLLGVRQTTFMSSIRLQLGDDSAIVDMSSVKQAKRFRRKVRAALNGIQVQVELPEGMARWQGVN
jgi:hypothetical protein